MPDEIIAPTVYFSRKGRENTARTLDLALVRLQALGIKKVLVATTGGETGVQAARIFKKVGVVVVTHSTGFTAPNEQQLKNEHRQTIEAAGARILTCQHALGGVNRAVRYQFETYQTDEIIANTLRIFGQGVKVCIEMSLMAADAGLVRTDEPAMCIAGSGEGADTAMVLQPTNAQRFFNVKILEIVCQPAPDHPGFVSI